MDWKLIAILHIALSLSVTAQPTRVATSEQKVVKYFNKGNEKIKDEGSKNSEHHEEYVDSYPSYEFSYKVSDPHTHDFKGQEERLDGDKLNGHYWLIEPDGRKRLVKYHANDHIGFNVLIEYSDKEKGNKARNEENAESETDKKNEKAKKRTWHVIQDIKGKKSSQQAESGQENQSNAESGSRESNAQQSGEQNNEEEKVQNKKGSSEINGNKWGRKKSNEQESKSGERSRQSETGSREKSKKEKSAEKKHWHNHHGKPKKGYEVIENQENSAENANEETADEGETNVTNTSNEGNVETNVEQENKQRESGESNSNEEKVSGYRSYIYHIMH